MKNLAELALVAASAAMLAVPAQASRGRGGVLIPSVDASGLLTVNATSFWRPSLRQDEDFPPTGGVFQVGISGNGMGATFNLSQTGGDDLSDPRFLRVEETGTIPLPGAGTYTLGWSGCCRVPGIANAQQGLYGTRSTIFWDGGSAIDPISFDLGNVATNVARGADYSDNLDAFSPDGLSLGYDGTDRGPTYDIPGLEPEFDGITAQAPGFDIDERGQITIPGASTGTYPDNPEGNDGADVAFSGRIDASGGGRTVASVQFDWLFDAVDVSGEVNVVPDVADVMVDAITGDIVDTLIAGSDPNDDPVMLSLLSFTGPDGIVPGAAFASVEAGSSRFTWDSSGAAPGTYVATILGSDGILTKHGKVTIEVAEDGGIPSPVPLPAGGVLLLTGLAGLGGMWRRRRT